MTDTAIAELAPEVGVRAACEVLGAAQAGYYRRHRQSPPPQRPDPIPHRERHQPRALREAERQAILDQLHSDRFVDVAPNAPRRCLDPLTTGQIRPHSDPEVKGLRWPAAGHGPS